MDVESLIAGIIPTRDYRGESFVDTKLIDELSIEDRELVEATLIEKLRFAEEDGS